MLRHSMKRFLNEFHEQNTNFSEETFQKAEEFLNSKAFHKNVRNEIRMTTIPKRKQTNAKDQTHVIKDAFTMVSLKAQKLKITLVV